MKYHLVALFDNESNKFIEKAQKNLCKKYKLYKTNKQFYIHIQTLIDPDMDKLNKIISEKLSPYKKFKVQIKPDFYLDKSFKTINFKIESKGYITRIARNITDTLKLSGFNLDHNRNHNLYISLANCNYSIRKSLNNEANPKIKFRESDDIYDYAKINRLELWKPINNKKEILVKNYPLREF